MVRYISEKLHAFYAAHRLVDDVEERFAILRESPLIYPAVNDEYLAALGFRFCLVRNYSIFYVVREPEQRVVVVRILFRKRSWADILKGADSLTLIKEDVFV
ncbi:MAG: type II toxin-antitoxin system RelE/ParE family toxin [Clostridiales Family XIII bacterium]|nr:type II toxin-antitoxin system RelE/ParE family toxin [Clostridiales Family XIII bacterium]